MKDSFKKYIPAVIALLVIVAAGAGYFVFKDKLGFASVSNVGEYKNDNAGFSFKYNSNEDGYEIIDQLAKAPSTNPDVLSAVTLIDKSDKELIENGTEPGETPPTLSLLVIKNPNGYSIKEWLEKESGYPNLDFLFDSVKKVTVDGIEGIYLVTDGVYKTQTVVLSDKDKIFVIVGAYIIEDSKIYKDFEEIFIKTLDIF